LADTNVFRFLLLISDADTNIFVLLKQYLFCLMRQNKHSWSYFAFSQTFQTTAERHSAYFSSGHIKSITSQVTIIIWGKIYTPGAILPPAKHDWLNWSHYKLGQPDCLSW